MEKLQKPQSLRTGKMGDITDFVNEMLGKNERISFEGARYFNDFELKDQQAILDIYRMKASNGELRAPVERKIRGIEETAMLYFEQKNAFQDVLTKKGFTLTEHVFRDYSGRVAALSNHGTLLVIGKNKDKGRHITMKRIHSPKYDIDGCRGFIKYNVKIGWNLILSTVEKLPGYRSSPIRALAVNRYGADGDELEAHTDIVTSMGRETELRFLRTKKISDRKRKIKD
jgi:hypothetical protein